MFTAPFGPGGADVAIHPANAPCMLAVPAAVAVAVAVTAGGAPPALLGEVPTSGSEKKDQPPPTPPCPFRCCFASAAVRQRVQRGGGRRHTSCLTNGKPISTIEENMTRGPAESCSCRTENSCARSYMPGLVPNHFCK